VRLVAFQRGLEGVQRKVKNPFKKPFSENKRLRGYVYECNP